MHKLMHKSQLLSLCPRATLYHRLSRTPALLTRATHLFSSMLRRGDDVSIANRSDGSNRPVQAIQVLCPRADALPPLKHVAPQTIRARAIHAWVPRYAVLLLAKPRACRKCMACKAITT